MTTVKKLILSALIITGTAHAEWRSWAKPAAMIGISFCSGIFAKYIWDARKAKTVKNLQSNIIDQTNKLRELIQSFENSYKTKIATACTLLTKYTENIPDNEKNDVVTFLKNNQNTDISSRTPNIAPPIITNNNNPMDFGTRA